MIRKLLATTAIATLVSSGVYAQETATEPAETTPPAATEQAPAATDDAAATDDPAATDDTAASDDAAAPAAGGEVKEAAVVQDGHLASNLIGETVYNGTGDDAENIGDVNDLVVTGEGEVKAIVIGVGGFLGIGEKSVAIDYSTIEWAERDGDRWIVVATTADQLKELPAFDKTPYEPEQPATAANDTGATGTDGMGAVGTMTPSTTAEAPADDSSGEMAVVPADDAAEEPADDTAAAPADDTADTAVVVTDDQATSDTAAAPADEAAEQPADDTAAAPADDTADTAVVVTDDETTSDTAAAPADDAASDTDETTTAAIDRSTLQEMNTADISAEEFVGTTVYGSNEEDIGEIGDVILTQDGQVDAVIIDVGGFLGVGEKQVAVGMDNLQFMADEDGNQYLYTTFTKEQLDAAPAYDESTYAENRDEQRIIMEN